jgi:hypothetical protein
LTKHHEGHGHSHNIERIKFNKIRIKCLNIIIYLVSFKELSDELTDVKVDKNSENETSDQNKNSTDTKKEHTTTEDTKIKKIIFYLKNYIKDFRVLKNIKIAG